MIDSGDHLLLGHDGDVRKQVSTFVAAAMASKTG
jgi:hypothetical protein